MCDTCELFSAKLITVIYQWILAMSSAEMPLDLSNFLRPSVLSES